MTYGLERIITSWDNTYDIHSTMAFYKYLDQLRAMGKMRDVDLCVGEWEGALEPSVMMLAVDYDEYIKDTDFVKLQTCILRVPADTRQPCTLDYGHSRRTLDPMRKVNSLQASQAAGWTYILRTQTYWSCQL